MKVKTIVVVNDFNYTQGGASKVAIDTARLLQEANYDVIFFSAVNKEEEKIEGVKYITTNQNEALKEKNRIKGICNGIYNFKVKQELKKLLTTLDRKSTIIHVHGWTKALSSSVFDIAFKMNFKIVLTLHDYFTACPNGGYFNYKKNEICRLKPLSWKCIKCNCDSRNYIFKLYRIIRQFVQNNIVRLNDRITNAITISGFSESILKNSLNKKTNIHKIYNPVKLNKDSNKVDYKKNQYYLYVGRVSPEKGVDIFCKAIAELGLEGVVVGDGPSLERLRKEYSSIKFVGWKDNNEVIEYMKKARALIFPSLWYETAGLTALEANSFGIPVFVNANCAATEFIIEGKNGYMFKNIEELKEKIQNQNIINVQINNAQYDEKIYLKELVYVYNKILEGVDDL